LFFYRFEKEQEHKKKKKRGGSSIANEQFFLFSLAPYHSVMTRSSGKARTRQAGGGGGVNTSHPTLTNNECEVQEVLSTAKLFMIAAA